MSNFLTNPTPDVYEGHAPEVKIRSKKMIMWIIIFAVVMLFAGITSAIMVLYGKLLWVHINPPFIFWAGIGLIVLSSLTMILSVRGLKAGNLNQAKWASLATFVLGLAFVYTQNEGWNQMKAMGMGNTMTKTEQGLTESHWNSLGKLNGNYGTDYYFELNGVQLVKEGDKFYLPTGDGTGDDKTLEVQTTFNATGALLSVLVYLHILHLIFGLGYLLVNFIRIQTGKLKQADWIDLHASGMYWHFMGILWTYLFFFIFFIY
jgi:heme/copper-type cytochrome/quinol oxidase subunit 3